MKLEISEDGFLHLLRAINGGALVDELDRELIKANCAVLDHGGKATISLKITVQRIKNLEAAMDIGHDLKVSLPEEERPHTAMFLTKGNGLSSQFQKQEMLPLLSPQEQIRPKLADPVEIKVTKLKQE